MNKPAKLAVLLSAGWLLIDLTLYLTGSFSGNENDAFLAYLIGGTGLINLVIWGHRWYAR